MGFAYIVSTTIERMRADVRQRLKWIRMYETIYLVCRRCRISRPTLRKWLRRYETLGVNGLDSKRQSGRRDWSSNAQLRSAKIDSILDPSIRHAARFSSA